MTNDPRIASRPLLVGEVLFDCFSDGRTQLGGAPFNVAWHLSALGLDPLLVSAVGEDRAGDEVLEAMEAWGLDTSGVARSPGRPTGRVNVELGPAGPTVRIERESAWDDIGEERALAAARSGSFGLLDHGSLAMRSERTHAAIAALRRALPGRIMVDLNLRHGWWSPDTVKAALAGTSILKINEQELEALDVVDPDELRASVAERSARLGEHSAIPEIVVTLGSRGSFALLGQETLELPASPLPGPLADTVGAGDAFSAVLICGRLAGWPDTLTLKRASGLAAWICTVQGAVSRDRDFYRRIAREWEMHDGQS